MAKEGESYLDELLNAVAPDWEDTSVSPESLMEEFEEEMDEDVSLEDALAILNDLPDSEEEYIDQLNREEEMDGLLGLDENEYSGIPEMDEPEMPLPDEGMRDLPIMESDKGMPEPAEELVVPEMDEPELPPVMEKDTPPPAEEPPIMEEEPDIPIVVDAIMPDDDMMQEPDSAGVSDDGMDVDDIFQDALSAVGYSGLEDEQEDLSAFGGADGQTGHLDDGIAVNPTADPMELAKGKKSKEKKGPGFFARIFGNVITDQTAAEEEKERQKEQKAAAKKAAKKEEKKKQAEASKEERAQHAQEDKERKRQLKAEKAAKKAEEKEEKKRKKEERKAEEAAQEVVGKINPVGAAIVVIFFATIGILTVFGSMLLSRTTSLNNAENLFASGDYLKAYDTVQTASMFKEDEVLYRRIRICSQIQKEIKSYTNYTSMGMKLEALDSLVKGIHHYDTNQAEAQTLGISDQVDALKNQITASLGNDFGVGEQEARELLAIADRAEYTGRLQQMVSGSSHI